jgi:hypothetical protein
MRVHILLGIALVVLLALVARHETAAEEITYVFGMTLDPNPNPTTAYYQAQKQAKMGLEIWRDWWNGLSVGNRTMSNGDAFKVALHFEDADYSSVTGSQQDLFDVYHDMSMNGSIDFFFVPVASPWDIQLRNYSYYALNIPFMLGMCKRFGLMIEL